MHLLKNTYHKYEQEHNALLAEKASLIVRTSKALQDFYARRTDATSNEIIKIRTAQSQRAVVTEKQLDALRETALYISFGEPAAPYEVLMTRHLTSVYSRFVNRKLGKYTFLGVTYKTAAARFQYKVDDGTMFVSTLAPDQAFHS